MDNKEKEIFSAIDKDIKDQAVLVTNQINNEVATMREDQIAYFSASLNKEVETYLEKELASLKSYASIKSSQEKMETKRKLLSLRQDLIDNMMANVKQRLITFTKSSDYQTWLKKNIDALPPTVASGCFFVRGEDIALFKTIMAKRNIKSSIEEHYYEIGGFSYACEQQGIRVDCTLDNNLQEQTTWFKDNSGFTI